ncbi:MAG: Minf_1886 family protein [Planctomycetaceae bacterium]
MALLRRWEDNRAQDPQAGIMKLTQTSPKLRYHIDAYRFVFESLQYMQEKLQRVHTNDQDEESAHLSGPELLDGVRSLGLQRYGLMARSVFEHWGIQTTEDFGKIVFELVERGEMRKTERDRISDFFAVYEFADALDREYEIPTEAAFA